MLQWRKKDIQLVARIRTEGPRNGEEGQSLFDKGLKYIGPEKKYDEGIDLFKRIWYAFPGTSTAVIAAYNVACGYSLKGEKEMSVDWFDIAMSAGFCKAAPVTPCPADARPHGGLEHLHHDTDLDNVREEERFKRSVEYYGGTRGTGD
jgi:hypothetical protein